MINFSLKAWWNNNIHFESKFVSQSFTIVMEQKNFFDFESIGEVQQLSSDPNQKWSTSVTAVVPVAALISASRLTSHLSNFTSRPHWWTNQECTRTIWLFHHYFAGFVFSIFSVAWAPPSPGFGQYIAHLVQLHEFTAYCFEQWQGTMYELLRSCLF